MGGATNINIKYGGGEREVQHQQSVAEVLPCDPLLLPPSPNGRPEHHLPHRHPSDGVHHQAGGGKSCGCCSSPQQLTYRKSRQEQQVLELVVYRVFIRLRRDTAVGTGDFIVIKLDTNQRFRYVIKAFPGSTLELVGVVETDSVPSLARPSACKAQGFRFNLRVKVLYVDKRLGARGSSSSKTMPLQARHTVRQISALPPTIMLISL